MNFTGKALFYAEAHAKSDNRQSIEMAVCLVGNNSLVRAIKRDNLFNGAGMTPSINLIEKTKRHDILSVPLTAAESFAIVMVSISVI